MWRCSPRANSSPFYDYSAESPGKLHKITTSDLPKPFATKSADNDPVPAARPEAPSQNSPGIQSRYLCYRPGRAAQDADRTQWRYFCGRDFERRNHGFSRRERRKTGAEINFCFRLNQPFGIAFYPAGKRSAMGLHRRYRFGEAFCLSQRRPESDGTSADHRR